MCKYIDEKVIIEFIGTINKGPFADLLKEVLQKNNGKKLEPGFDENNVVYSIYGNALYQAYLDACRTFKTKDDKTISVRMKALENLQDKKIDEIPEKVKSLIAKMHGFVIGKADFNFYTTKHNPEEKGYCDLLIEYACESCKDGMKYGQAQKIINMAFKYLYCYLFCEDKINNTNKIIDTYNERFSNCHMALDKFTLEWFKREIKSPVIDSWSSLEDGSEDENKKNKNFYQYYASEIKEYCKNKNENPFFLEFIVWLKMQKELACEAFIKSFYGIKVNEALSDEILKDIENALPGVDVDSFKKDGKNRCLKEIELENKRKIVNAIAIRNEMWCIEKNK